MEKLLSTNNIAEYLDVTPATVRRKALNGEIPSIKVGNRLRFNKQQVDKWIMQNSKGRRIPILVVDDEPVVGQLIKDSLDEFGYQVTNTLSSLDALGLLSNGHFDLIFLDLLIPELDGAELFRRIRQIDKLIPVVIITGYADSEVMKRAMQYGPFMILRKPFTGDDILNTVQIFVDRMTTRIKT